MAANRTSLRAIATLMTVVTVAGGCAGGNEIGEEVPSTAVALDGLTVSGSVASEDGPGVVTASGQGFLLVSHGDPSASVAESSDGINWVPVDADLPIPFVQRAAGDGERVVVAGSTASSDVEFWESMDNGVHWSELPALPTTDGIEPPVRPFTDITGLAVSGSLVVAHSRVSFGVDWRAYAIAELGQDHGAASGESSSGEGELIVEFEDGFELVVDPASLGLRLDELIEQRRFIDTYDGSTWSRSEVSWPPGLSDEIVSGPAGFAAVVGEAPPEVMLSDDGRTWSAHPLPGVAGQFGSLAGGPLGYVVVGEDSVSFSGDGMTWDEVHRFEDLDPTFAGGRTSAGGPAGFVFVEDERLRSVEGEPSPARPGRALWSVDGRNWSEHELAGLALRPASGAELNLVVPFMLTAR